MDENGFGVGAVVLEEKSAASGNSRIEHKHAFESAVSDEPRGPVGLPQSVVARRARGPVSRCYLLLEPFDESAAAGVQDEVSVFDSVVSFPVIECSFRGDAVKLCGVDYESTGTLLITNTHLVFMSDVSHSFFVPHLLFRHCYRRFYYGSNRALECFFANGCILYFVLHDISECVIVGMGSAGDA